MGLLDRLFGRKPQNDVSSPGAAQDAQPAATAAPAQGAHGARDEQWTPHPVQQELIEAIRDNKKDRLKDLCEQHREVIVEHFSKWRRVPAEARKDKALQDAYVQAHVAVARCFANELGDASLLQLLVGKPQENPIDNWRDQLERSTMALEAGEFDRARTLLEDVLQRMEGCEGSAIENYKPTAQSMLGLCLFELRQPEKAIPLLTSALETAIAQNDLKAQIAYTGNLYEICRYLGQNIVASEYAEALAELMTRANLPQGRWFTRQAKIVEKGEPLLRVVAVISDVYYELKAMPARTKDQKIQLVYQRNRRELKPCIALCNKGQNLLNHQKFSEAIDVLAKASDLDLYAPMPSYLAGIALLHMKQYEAAIDGFQETDRLGPGWYQNSSFLWMANRLAKGYIDHETFVALQMLESGMGSLEERLNLAGAAISRNPDVPGLYLQQAIVLEELGRTKDAKYACNRGLDAAKDEPDVGSRLLLRLAQMAEANSDEQYELFDRVSKVKGGHLIAQAQARVAVGTIR